PPPRRFVPVRRASASPALDRASQSLEQLGVEARMYPNPATATQLELKRGHSRAPGRLGTLDDAHRMEHRRRRRIQLLPPAQQPPHAQSVPPRERCSTLVAPAPRLQHPLCFRGPPIAAHHSAVSADVVPFCWFRWDRIRTSFRCGDALRRAQPPLHGLTEWIAQRKDVRQTRRWVREARISVAVYTRGHKVLDSKRLEESTLDQ